MDHYYTAFLGREWVPNFDVHPKTSQLEMVIVEPRKHECLAGVLSNMSCLIPNAMLTIFHSKDNEDMVRSIVKSSGDNHVRMIPAFDGNIDRDTYSALLMSPEFWSSLTAPKTLIFQTDTALRYNGILRFMEYDYIGAPWLGPVCENPHVRIGNGGFSLRTRNIMEDITHKHPLKHGILPEDVYFGNHVHLYNDVSIPTLQDAAWFSLEYLRHPNPMAAHKAWTFDIHPEEYIRDIMTSSNLAPCKPNVRIRLIDAWVERENGGICRTYNLVSWLCLGISTDGLRIPQGTLLQCIEKDPFPGYKKYLKIHMQVNDDTRLYSVRLFHNRILEELHIHK
jgi:hypothetical protein